MFVPPLFGLLDRSGPDGPLPALDPDPAGPLPDLARGFAAWNLARPVSDPGPLLAGPAVEPDDIETWYARPRRRRRRRLALAAAVLTAATAWGGAGPWPSPAPPSSPGHAYTPHHRPVIIQARARQRRRRRRIAQAAAPLLGAAAGWAAAGGPHSRLWPRTGHNRPGRHTVTGSRLPGVTGINAFGWQCPNGTLGIASDDHDVWEACAEHNGLEFNASTGAFVANHMDASYGFNSVQGIPPDGTHVWFAKANGGSVTELDAVNGHLVKALKRHSYGFCYPAAVVTDSTHVWVVNDPGGGSLVTEMGAATGRLVKVLKGHNHGFNRPAVVASDRTPVWLSKTNGGLTFVSAAAWSGC